MIEPRTLIFLPGASGDPNFWRGLGCCLPRSWTKHHLHWPGLGEQTPDSEIRGMDDLVRLVENRLHVPSVLVAQSMGGIVAMLVALRHPELVTHLILTATSGGLGLASFAGEDWRPDYLRLYPHAARWITTERINLRPDLHRLTMPTLLLWGGRDRISPPAVGEFLAGRIPGAQLQVIPDGEHAMGFLIPEELASYVNEFLGATEMDFEL